MALYLEDIARTGNPVLQNKRNEESLKIFIRKNTANISTSISLLVGSSTSAVSLVALSIIAGIPAVSLFITAMPTILVALIATAIAITLGIIAGLITKSISYNYLTNRDQEKINGSNLFYRKQSGIILDDYFQQTNDDHHF